MVNTFVFYYKKGRSKKFSDKKERALVRIDLIRLQLAPNDKYLLKLKWNENRVIRDELIDFFNE